MRWLPHRPAPRTATTCGCATRRSRTRRCATPTARRSPASSCSRHRRPAAIVTKELTRATQGRCSASDVPTWTTGSPATARWSSAPPPSPIVAALGWDDVLTGLGPEGYVIRSGPHRRPARARRRVERATAARSTARSICCACCRRRRRSSASTSRERPRLQLRLLNHWDNLDGTIERGYAGPSLWQWDELPDAIDPRLHDYARANASIGINGAVINSVNANAAVSDAGVHREGRGDRATSSAPTALTRLSLGQLRRAARRSAGCRPPIRSIRPCSGGGKRRPTRSTRLIPDFGGFLVKANSEGQPGPQDYGRTHADGANVLADAVAPHGGIVMWRAFVYDADVDPDRVKRAYMEFVPLDGKFRDNVFVAGQERPARLHAARAVSSAVRRACRRRRSWRSCRSRRNTSASRSTWSTWRRCGRSSSTPTPTPRGRDRRSRKVDRRHRSQGQRAHRHRRRRQHRHATSTGPATHFAQANWYAFGRLAWNPALTAEAHRRRVDPHDVEPQAGDGRRPSRTIMLGSREAFVNYTMPLGLHHLIGGDHYAPMPENDDKRRADWSATYYHRADAQGIGFDRDADRQRRRRPVPPSRCATLERSADDAGELLLWFHHLPWDYRLKLGPDAVAGDRRALPDGRRCKRRRWRRTGRR